jgi:hypothetical protein
VSAGDPSKVISPQSPHMHVDLTGAARTMRGEDGRSTTGTEMLHVERAECVLFPRARPDGITAELCSLTPGQDGAVLLIDRPVPAR